MEESKKLTFEELLPRAKKIFFSVYIREATPEECLYYKEYFKQYPNKGSYKDFYNKALKKAAFIVFTDFYYETPTRCTTPEELLQYITETEEELQQLELLTE